MRAFWYAALSWLSFASADIHISLQSPATIHVPTTVFWKRAVGDITEFTLQTISFDTQLSFTPDIKLVNTTDSTLSGNIQITSQFAGPHIIVALSPVSQSGLVATSSQFDVVDPSKLSTVTSDLGDNTSTNPSTSSSPSVHSRRCEATSVGVIVGGAIGAVAIVCISIISLFCVRAYYKRRSERLLISGHDSVTAVDFPHLTPETRASVITPVRQSSQSTVSFASTANAVRGSRVRSSPSRKRAGSGTMLQSPQDTIRPYTFPLEPERRQTLPTTTQYADLPGPPPSYGEGGYSRHSAYQ